MAQRPVFKPSNRRDILVEVVNIEFQWFPGFSAIQKQKSIYSLHTSASMIGIEPILEISSKSPDEMGSKLSAFNLLIEEKSGYKIPVEGAFQGGKIFSEGGPYPDLYDLPGKVIKKDPRLTSSGDLTGFVFQDQRWALEPKTAFYDWIYINALSQNTELSNKLVDYAGFTDIEFNPKKSINCQAYSAALYVSIRKKGQLSDVLCNKERFLDIYSGSVPVIREVIQDQFDWE